MRRLRLGVAGLGTVGGALVRQLVADKAQLSRRAQCDIELVVVSARRTRRAHDVGAEFVADPVALASRDDVDCVVELIGGEAVAREVVEIALSKGKHVITANKALLAHHGMELARLAEQQGVALNYEAAVAAAIPVVKILRESRTADAVKEISGILNGTCNYILCEMEKTGRSFEVILAEAQAAGYAEADPSFDVRGEDAAHKLALLTSLAFGCVLSQVETQGIENIGALDIKLAGDMGYRVRLVASSRLRGDRVESAVCPALVPRAGRLAQIDGAGNAVFVQSMAGALLLEGAGAGALPTASAVMADILDVARGQILPVFGIPVDELRGVVSPATIAEKSSGPMAAFYLRLFARDRAGSMAAILQEMASADISLAGVNQPAVDDEQDHAPVALLTHRVSQQHIDRALAGLAALGEVVAKPLALRIEE